MEKKTICIDFDGVIHDYGKGYQSEDKFGAMIAGADTGTSVLKQKGWTVIIFTTRKKSDKLENWLKEHTISPTITSMRTPVSPKARAVKS